MISVLIYIVEEVKKYFVYKENKDYSKNVIYFIYLLIYFIYLFN